MCRCLACNKRLSDRESTRRYASSGTFVDLCNQCFSEVAEEIPDIDGTGVDLPDEPEDNGLSTNDGFNPYYNYDDESK